MVLLEGFEPLKYVQEGLVVFLAVIVLSVVYVYWNRVIYLLTGDDRLHISCLDCIWWGCCRCGGCCSGEWTRFLSRWPCCPRRLRGKNLIKAFGQVIGWATHSIEIKNVIVGDLPFDNGRGDFYLSVEAATNPPMVTALQEEKLPKVVHFPEIIGLKIRDSILEKRVRIIVKELNVIGSVELCDCHINSTALIDWAQSDNPEQRVKRLQMRNIDNSIERETPPWILLELAEADDVRGVDTLPTNQEGGMFIRTWVPTDHESVRASGAQPIAYSQNQGFGQNKWSMGAARQNVDMQVSPFKHTYTLLDDSGNPVAEPDEENLAYLRRMRMCVMCVVGSFQSLIVLAILFWCSFRFYIWSCYRHFRWITEAKLRQATFPISIANLHEYVKDCHNKMDGTGATASSGVLAAACRPTDASIQATCTALPVGQPRPEAFTALMHEWFGVTLKTGVFCFDGICNFRNHIVTYDHWIAIAAVLLVISSCLCKMKLNDCIRSARREGQTKQAQQQKSRLGVGGNRSMY
jgi:hypothetical protein